jgi:hypothetical protein
MAIPSPNIRQGTKIKKRNMLNKKHWQQQRSIKPLRTTWVPHLIEEIEEHRIANPEKEVEEETMYKTNPDQISII